MRDIQPIDFKSLISLHRPIDGYRYCPHESAGIVCPAGGPCIEHVKPTFSGTPYSFLVLPVIVCEHCIIGSSGCDLPFWIDEASTGLVDHIKEGSRYPEELYHRLWPCPTAVALGL